jgi:hypothetical protein
VLTLLTIAVHGAGALIAWSALPGFAGAALAVLVCLVGVFAARDRALLSSRDAPTAIELNRDGSLSIVTRSGAEAAVEPAERRYVTRWLVVLKLQRPAQPARTLVVARDMLPAGQFRHLRLWALWKALPVLRPAPSA